MPFAVRALAFCLVAFGIAGCGASNNKSRIEGKWQVVPTRAADENLRGVSLVFGEMGEVLLHRPGVSQPTQWRYKLLAGDAADFYDLPPDATDRAGLFPTANGVARVTIRIEITPGSQYERREMTLSADDGRELKLELVR